MDSTGVLDRVGVAAAAAGVSAPKVEALDLGLGLAAPGKEVRRVMALKDRKATDHRDRKDRGHRDRRILGLKARVTAMAPRGTGRKVMAPRVMVTDRSRVGVRKVRAMVPARASDRKGRSVALAVEVSGLDPALALGKVSVVTVVITDTGMVTVLGRALAVGVPGVSVPASGAGRIGSPKRTGFPSSKKPRVSWKGV